MLFDSQKDALVFLQLEADQLCDEWKVPRIVVTFKGILPISTFTSLMHGEYIAAVYIVPGNKERDPYILLSTLSYRDKGFSGTLGTLRHEIAHHITYFKYNDIGETHGEPFLTVCKKLGGTLGEGTFRKLTNEHQHKYKDLTTNLE